MRNRILLFAFLFAVVLSLVATSVPVYAQDMPTFTDIKSSIFRNLLEEGDMLVLSHYKIHYAAVPAEHTVEWFQLRLYDYDDSLMSTAVPFLYEDDGFGLGVVGFYLNAASGSDPSRWPQPLSWWEALWSSPQPRHRIRLIYGPTGAVASDGYLIPEAAYHQWGVSQRANRIGLGEKLIEYGGYVSEQFEVPFLTAEDFFLSIYGEYYFYHAAPGTHLMAHGAYDKLRPYDFKSLDPHTVYPMHYVVLPAEAGVGGTGVVPLEGLVPDSFLELNMIDYDSVEFIPGHPDQSVTITSSAAAMGLGNLPPDRTTGVIIRFLLRDIYDNPYADTWVEELLISAEEHVGVPWRTIMYILSGIAALGLVVLSGVVLRSTVPGMVLGILVLVGATMQGFFPIQGIAIIGFLAVVALVSIWFLGKRSAAQS